MTYEEALKLEKLDDIKDCLFGLIAVLDGFFTAYSEKNGFQGAYTYARNEKWKAMIEEEKE